MTQARLNDILANYEKVSTAPAEDTGDNSQSDADKEREEYEAFLAAKHAAEKK
jgi:hypothetical protein